MKFKPYYFYGFVILLLVEIYIATHIQDDFIRPYVGDFLVVILIYAMVRSFFRFSAMTTAIAVLLFAFSVEILQYFRIVDRLGLSESSLARVIIGTSFSWEDLLAYTLGIIVTLLIERWFAPPNK
ncbi:MAG: DUF2809 domain-containing protein [Leptolyngbyaceae bacterium]|nr:DUF2809 domain-containing protein [Leptolyngbyaceae bacterium]